MKEMVTVSHKRQFIQWFLHHYELKDPMARWLLESLANHELLLTNVHFTEHLQTGRKAVLISTKCVQMASFKFYHMHRISTDVEKAFLDIHQHPEQELYVTLYFRNRMHASEYRMVLEQPEAIRPIRVRLESLQVDLFLDDLLHRDRLNKLYHHIDVALAQKDKEGFMLYTEEYLRLLNG